MTRYLISFDDGAMTFPEEDLPAVDEAAHAVTREAQDAGVWVFAGGLYPVEEVSVVATDGRPATARRARRTSAGSRSSTCPHARRRWGGLPSTPSPAAVLKRSASSCLTRPWGTDRARRTTSTCIGICATRPSSWRSALAERLE